MPAWLPQRAIPLWLPAMATVPTGSGQAALGMPTWDVLVTAIWAAGCAFVLARLCLGLLLLKLECKRGKPCADREWQSDFTAASDTAGLNPHLIELRLGHLNSPVTFGFRKPVILLPQNATTWSAPSRQAVLLHELTHIRRRDWLWNCLAQIALTVFWFHPLAWALYGVLRREEELACDDDALLYGIAPAAYAGVLLEIARSLPSRFLLASAISGKGGAAQLRASLERILQAPNRRPVNSHAGGAAVAFLLVVLAGCTSLNASGPAKVYQIGGDVSAPRLLYKVEPQYSEAAKKDKLQGSTLLAVMIGADGRPGDIQVVQSLRPDLDANGVAAVQQWRFHPAMRQGAPVAVKAQVEINFKLQ
jgi:TonB family protein